MGTSASTRPSRQRILVADDDATTREAIAAMLRSADYEVKQAKDGTEALHKVQQSEFDLVFLDVWMPGLSGLDALKLIREVPSRPKVIIMTSDGTPENVLRAVREQAYEFVAKPFPPKHAIELAQRALEDTTTPVIDVISATPNWVELSIPCTREAAERIQGFMNHLEANLSEEIRATLGQVFRELLLNAVEWGGKLDATRRVRIAQLRSSRMILYRIADPGPGFRMEDLEHAAVGHPDDPVAHIEVRDKLGLRPGGFGIMMIQAMADELIYNEARNEVVFIKYLPDSA